MAHAVVLYVGAVETKASNSVGRVGGTLPCE